MTIYACSICGRFHDSTEPPCVQTIKVAVVQICDRCGDIVLAADGSCPVCSQQVVYDFGGGGRAPLSIVRGGHFRKRRQRGRSAGPVGHHSTCAVVMIEDRNHGRGAYLTACGDVVTIGCSVWSRPPSCVKCRRTMRENAARKESHEQRN